MSRSALVPQIVFPFWAMISSLLAASPGEWGCVLPVEKERERVQKINWKSKIGSASGSPVVHDGRIFIGTNNAANLDPQRSGDAGVMMCFDRITGQMLWQEHRARLAQRVHDLPLQGISSRPFAENDRLYYVSNRGELVCLKTPEAKEPIDRVIWKIDMIQEFGVFQRAAGDMGNPLPSPIVFGDIVYSLTGNGTITGYEFTFPALPFVPRPQSPSFIAVNKKTGKLIWKSNAPQDRIGMGNGRRL
jgi:outer membrane protein assembly factor BamB